MVTRPTGRMLAAADRADLAGEALDDGATGHLLQRLARRAAAEEALERVFEWDQAIAELDGHQGNHPQAAGRGHHVARERHRRRGAVAPIFNDHGDGDPLRAGRRREADEPRCHGAPAIFRRARLAGDLDLVAGEQRCVPPVTTRRIARATRSAAGRLENPARCRRNGRRATIERRRIPPCAAIVAATRAIRNGDANTSLAQPC